MSGRRFQVHAKAWTSVDLDDDRPLSLKRLHNILCDDVDAGDIQADNSGSFDRLTSYIGMDQIGNV